MQNVNERQKASLILLIDFKKAFDSIDHSFITTILIELGFGGDVVKWIGLFFDSREAYILLGGHLTKKILLEQGVPQGVIHFKVNTLFGTNDLVPGFYCFYLHALSLPPKWPFHHLFWVCCT